MSSRPPSKLVIQCIDDLLHNGAFVDSEAVAELLKESCVKYKRYKTSILARLVEPIIETHLQVRRSSTQGFMNASVQQLYAQHAPPSTASAPTASSVPDDTLARSTTTEGGLEEESGEKEKKVRPKRSDRLTDLSESDVDRRRRQKRRLVSDTSDADAHTDQTYSGLPSKDFFPQTSPPDFTLSALAGIEKAVDEVRNFVIRPLKHRAVYAHVGARPPTGILIHGPPGSGKTKLALATAGEAKVPFFKISAPELIAGVTGESESLLRSLFNSAQAAAPSLIFIDEVDTLCPKRETASREMERRIVAQLATCMDNLADSFVVVLGATNRADALDPMIRRNGRFDREIALGIPDEAARSQMLRVMAERLRIAEDVDYQALGKLTPGFVGADLETVTKEAALVAVDRIFGTTLAGEEDPCQSSALDSFYIEQQDFLAAVRTVQPSAKREGFATTPDVSWEDVGGLWGQRQELEDQICHPIRDSVLYHNLGITVPAGILLFGPPGCGKTLLAKAVAGESGANFISIKGPELLNKYVGESERAIRQVFQRARMSAPCIIFFDELDSLCCRRGNEGSGASERMVNQLLTEMDGVEERRQVYVIAATNRPELIDPAMLRPGRLDRLVCVPLPDLSKRIDILRRLGRRIRLNGAVNLEMIAAKTEGYSGADLAALLRQAGIRLLDDLRRSRSSATSGGCCDPGSSESLCIEEKHILEALGTMQPSVTAEHIAHYEEVSNRMRTFTRQA